MKDDLLVVCYIISCLIIWFDTSAFVEYVKLLKIDWLFGVEDYERERNKNGPLLEYYEWLDLKYSNFMTKLISCPICVAFWLTLFFGLLAGSAGFLPIYFVGGIAGYLFVKSKYQ